MPLATAMAGCWVKRSTTPPTSPPPGRALLTISQPQWEALAKGNVWVVEGGQLVGKFYPGRYTTIELSPGLHEFVSLDEFRTVGTLRVTAEAGRHYRVRLQRFSGTTVPIAAGVTVVPYTMYRFGWFAVLPDSPHWDLDEGLKGLKWPVEPIDNTKTRRKAERVARKAERTKVKLETVVLGPEDGAPPNANA